MGELMNRREAKRKQQREDFERATQQALLEHGHGKLAPDGGKYAGKTIRQHVEDIALDAAEDYVRDKTPTKRGILRGAALCYLAHVDSYSLDDPAKLKQVETRLVREAHERIEG